MSVVEVERPTPLAFPLLVDRAREQVTSEKLGDRIRRMAAPLERAAERAPLRAREPPRISERRDERRHADHRGRGRAAPARAGAVLAARLHPRGGGRALGEGRDLSRRGHPYSGRHDQRGPGSTRPGALQRTGARRLLVLGDLFHARAGRIATRTLATLRGWRERTSRSSRSSWSAATTIATPAIRPMTSGSTASTRRLSCLRSCFATSRRTRRGLHSGGARPPRPDAEWSGLPAGAASLLPGAARTVTLLPAFGSFTGGAPVYPEPGDRAFVVADGEVLAVG